MEAVLLVIHLIVALAIIAVVLLQPSESGGFLGSSGSMSNLMAPRRTGDALTRATAILAGCFFLSSLLLAIIAENRAPAKSILDVETGPAATGSAPAKTEEQLKEKPVAPISQ